MINFLKRWFQRLLGTGQRETAPSPQPAKPARPYSPNVQPQEPVAVSEAETEAAVQQIPLGPGLRMQRISKGPYDTLGELYWNGERLGYTLEGPTEARHPDHTLIPAGSYPLFLHAEGGKHATYAYRFGEEHHGLLALKGTGRSTPIVLHIGFTGKDLYGSIGVGQSLVTSGEKETERKLSFGETAYRKIYQAVAPILVSGQSVELYIEDMA